MTGRIIIGILAGIVAAIAAVWAVEMISHLLHPLPASLDIWNRPQVGDYIRSMPAAAQALVVLAWLLGPLIGGALAVRIAERRWAAWPVAGLIAVAGIANILYYSHPLWMQLAAAAAPLLGGLIASRTAPRAARPIEEGAAS